MPAVSILRHACFSGVSYIDYEVSLHDKRMANQAYHNFIRNGCIAARNRDDVLIIVHGGSDGTLTHKEFVLKMIEKHKGRQITLSTCHPSKVSRNNQDIDRHVRWIKTEAPNGLRFMNRRRDKIRVGYVIDYPKDLFFGQMDRHKRHYPKRIWEKIAPKR